MILAIILVWGCVTGKGRENGKEKAEPVSEEPKSPGPGEPISSLLPNFKVTVDSCNVFLEPKEQSPHFGPLQKGERVKWLDVQGRWVRIWIPRLRISGWVRGEQVIETRDKPPKPMKLPQDLMTTVIVTAKRANIREAPTTRSRILFVAKKNQAFWLLNEKAGWHEIWLPKLKKKGWISSRIAARRRKR